MFSMFLEVIFRKPKLNSAKPVETLMFCSSIYILKKGKRMKILPFNFVEVFTKIFTMSYGAHSEDSHSNL